MKAITTVGRLLTALTAVMPFANRDETLPALCSVQLTAADGTLTASATDRYAIGRATSPATGDLPPVLLDLLVARTVRHLLRRIARYESGEQNPVTITVADGTPRMVTVAVDLLNISITSPEPDGKFPDLDETLDGTATAEDAQLTGPAGLPHSALAQLAEAMKAAEDSMGIIPPAHWHWSGPKTPVRVTVGDWLTVVLMPVRIGGAS